MTTSFLEIPYLAQNVLSPETPENEAKDILDAAIAGQLVVPMVIDTTYVLKLTNTDSTSSYPHEWQYGILIVNTTNTVQTALHVPDGYKKQYIVYNNTGQNLVFKTVSEGTGITIPNGSVYNTFSDGTNVRRIT